MAKPTSAKIVGAACVPVYKELSAYTGAYSSSASMTKTGRSNLTRAEQMRVTL
jgi:hypothetical protein